MQAVLSLECGGPESLRVQEVSDPVPEQDQVVIAVKACGVNFPDALVIEDKYQERPERPFSPGCEIAGVVESVGANVKGFSAGDRVIGETKWGGMAQKLALDHGKLIKMPDAMPFETGAAFLFTYSTSYHALVQRAQVKPGETVLVLGAAGGVGLAAVEIATALGARVIAAASSPAKVELAKKHGAQEGVVYPKAVTNKEEARKLSGLLKQASGGEGVDIVYDAVGGGYSEPALRALKWNGRYLVVGFPAGIPLIPLNLTLLKGCSIIGVFWGTFAQKEPELHRQNVHDLLGMYEAGKIAPYVCDRYPLARASEAIAQLSSRQAMGKVVVTIET